MTEYESISIPDEDKDWWDKFLELRWKERKDKASFIRQACKEFFDNHSKAENQPSLDHFSEEGRISTPSFTGASSQVIDEYLSSLKGSTAEIFNNKMQEWTYKFKKHHPALAWWLRI